jgi:polyribonucleotide nucleotidyltransferase
VKRAGSWGRADARSGTGALAERSLMGVLPDAETFPYTIRLVSDITESNGSSSMASVCGGCLALMDAGVPILNTVAGISVGRVEVDGEEVFITDIIGEEDFFGDMDFKVSGSRQGITGIQLDLKARGLVIEQVKRIFEQAREARIQIIEAIESCLPEPRSEISKYAPGLVKIQIDPEKIGKLIGRAERRSAASRSEPGLASRSRRMAPSSFRRPTRTASIPHGPRSRPSPRR